jgi:short-subunit dehydrogenase
LKNSSRLQVEVELLVNNAGIGLIGQIQSTTPEDVRRLLNLNLTDTWPISRTASCRE